MGFIMHGLDKDLYDRNYSDRELFSRIANYFAPYAKFMLIVVTFVVLQAAANGTIPYLFSQTIDSMEDNFKRGQLVTQTQEFYTLIGIILGLYVFAFISNAVSAYLGAKAVQSTVMDIRQDVFDSLMEKDMAFFSETPTGRLVSRVTNDTADFGQTVSLSTNLLAQVLNFFFILFYLFAASVRLTILLLLFAPVIVLVALSFRKLARGVARQSNRVLARVNALIQETTSGIYVAKSFRAEQQVYDEFSEMNELSYSVNLRRGLVFNSIFPILNILTYIATAIIVYVGPLQTISDSLNTIPLLNLLPDDNLTGGQVFLFLQGLNLFFFPLVQIASFWSQFQQGLAGAERVFSIIDRENQVRQDGTVVLDKIEGHITFDGVTFGYKVDLPIIEHFNLDIKPGENLAIVGHTGAGKSTLAKLIGRYYEYQKGDIRIDDVSIRDLDLYEYRKKLAVISQEVFLWNASIKENILYGTEFQADQINSDTNVKKSSPRNQWTTKSDLRTYDPKVEEKMINILSDIEALDWINNLEGGFDMPVGERGARLSQGQRQLIAFARILMQNPSILIMDEATASVDPFTELQIQKAINLLMEGRTSIVIAHRLSTVRNVDRIIVLKEGKIIEEGSHDQLMAQGGHYRELYDTYFRHQSLDYIEKVAQSSD